MHTNDTGLKATRNAAAIRGAGKREPAPSNPQDPVREPPPIATLSTDTRPPPRPPRPDVTETTGPLVLVVDDDPMMRFLARETLEPRGFRVEEAEDGAACLALARVMRPDLIILDVQMPEMDGFTACSRLRAQAHGVHIPILMMTGLDDVASIQHAYQVGATDFITKPINFTLLEFRLYYMLRAKLLGDELRSSEATLAAAQRIARLGHWDFQPGAGFVRWSPQCNDVLGLTPDARITQVDEFLLVVLPEDRESVSASFADCARAAASEPIEYQIRDQSGSTRVIRQHMQCLQTGDADPVYMGTVQDITERRRAEQQIHDLAFYDRITGLPNRTLLEHNVDELLPETRGIGFRIALLNINIDHFQRFNDHFGHGVGNELLQALARRLGGNLRRESAVTRAPGTVPDFIARSAGDEFCVVVTQPDARTAATRLAARIHETLRAPFVIGDEELSITVSIGIAISEDSTQSADELLRQATLAVRHAKRQGRDTTQIFDPALELRAEQRRTLESGLRQAIGTAQIQLAYQPKLDPASGRATGMEALVRWDHPELGSISPAEFIPVAEETGLILPLGEAILRRACETIVRLHGAGHTGIVCAVNLSAAQFRDLELPARVAAILQETGAAPAQLQLELTESLVMQDEKRGLEMLHKLRGLGLSLAIDDFGTGHSSLSYLTRLPVETVKIDQSFVRTMQPGSDEALIVEAVIALAHGLRLAVVAEGVERQDQLDHLRRLGCDEVQGYLLGKPMREAEFTAWLVSNLRASDVRRFASAG